MPLGVQEDVAPFPTAGEEKEDLIRRTRLIRWISLAFTAIFVILAAYLGVTGSSTFPFWPVIAWLEFGVWCLGALIDLMITLFVTGGLIARLGDEGGPSQRFLHHLHQMAFLGALFGGVVPGLLLFLQWRKLVTEKAGEGPEAPAAPLSGPLYQMPPAPYGSGGMAPPQGPPPAQGPAPGGSSAAPMPPPSSPQPQPQPMNVPSSPPPQAPYNPSPQYAPAPQPVMNYNPQPQRPVAPQMQPQMQGQPPVQYASPPPGQFAPPPRTICPSCGSRVDPQQRVCLACGRSLL